MDKTLRPRKVANLEGIEEVDELGVIEETKVDACREVNGSLVQKSCDEASLTRLDGIRGDLQSGSESEMLDQ